MENVKFASMEKLNPRYVVWCGVRGRVAHLLSSRLETGAAAAVTVVTVVTIATAQSSAECEGEHSSVTAPRDQCDTVIGPPCVTRDS